MPAPLPPLPAGIKAIDLYGTTRFTVEDLRRKLGDRLTRWLETEDEAESRQLGGELEAELLNLGFAWVGLSPIGYYKEGGEMEWYVTIDVVEERDRARRMAFGAAPTAELADVAGLAAAWDEYMKRGTDLRQAGALKNVRVACPAFHCLHGFEHPELAAFGTRFDADVPAHRDALVRLLREARDARLRGAAAFLLAHLRDGDDVVAVLLPALRDPDSLVRNNAMRVLQDIAHHRPDVAVPVEPALAAIDFPATTDRNKALAMLHGLAARPELRPAIRARAPQLIAALRLQQPNNHDFAYQILKTISGEAHGERDYAAWERWAARAHLATTP